jgi:hypothetical protein
MDRACVAGRRVVEGGKLKVERRADGGRSRIEGAAEARGASAVPWLRILRAGFPRYGGAVVPWHAMTKVAKKECLFLTNKAVMLLKTRDRALRTKPILATN